MIFSIIRMNVIWSISEYVVIQSRNCPGYYFGTDDGIVIYLHTAAYRLIVITPGLSEEDGTVSFQSLEDPSKYLCIDNLNLIFRVKHTYTDNGTFNGQATFRIWTDKYFSGSVAFESYTMSNYFIRHDGMELKLQEGSDDESFTQNASFHIVHPAAHYGKIYPYYF